MVERTGAEAGGMNVVVEGDKSTYLRRAGRKLGYLCTLTL